MASASEVFVSLLIVLIILFVLWSRKRLNYFKERNVPYVKSIPFIGALSDAIIGKTGLYEATEALYYNEQFKDEPFFGIFMFHKPAIFIKDPELVKNVMVRDFNSFRNHRAGSGDHDPLGSYNLFSSKDAKWATLRKKLSPFFSSGHLRNMFPVVDKIGDEMMAQIDSRFGEKESIELEVKQMVMLYTLDVIASCAYGVEANSLKNPQSEFSQLGHKLFNFTFRRGVEFTAIFLLPEIMKYINCKFFTNEGSEFIMQTMLHVMGEREKSGIKRNDLIDTLIEIKNTTPVFDDGTPVTIEMLIAQAAVFFSAGFETSATTTTHAIFEMAKNAEIQERVRREIADGLARNGGVLTSDALMNESPYLQQVLLETLRMYAIIPLIDRECTNPDGYSLQPFSDFVIPPKMPVYIPLHALHRDEKYFKEPLTFDPDRFSPENIHSIPSGVFMPFGAGNRVCIGERFGLMQTKVAIAKLLRTYRVELADSTPRTFRFAKNAFLVQSVEPLIFNLIKDELVF